MDAELYYALTKIHWISVLCFIVLYLFKSVLVIINKSDVLNNIKPKLKIPDAIISAVFVLTGIVLAMFSGNLHQFFWMKLVFVISSIPIGIVAFKKSNKILAFLCVLCLVSAYGMAEMNKSVTKKALQKTLTNLPKTSQNSKADSTKTPTENVVALGKTLYTSACVTCHGEKGDLGKSGAKNLTTTTLNADAQKERIIKGKGVMPAYGSLSPEQVNAIVTYLQTLKK